MIVLALAALVSTVQLRGQQPANQPEVKTREVPPPFQIRVERSLVTVRVVVRDPKRHTVGNLSQNDFRLLDDGNPQEISGFSVETSGGNATPAAPVASSTQPGAANASPRVRESTVPQRFVGLFFDDLHLQLESVQRTRDAAWKYVATETSAADRVGIFSASGYDDLDFTDDRDKLHDAPFRLAPRPHTPEQESCMAIDPYEAYLAVKVSAPDALAVLHAEAEHCYCGAPLPGGDVDMTSGRPSTMMLPANQGGATGAAGPGSIAGGPTANNCDRQGEILAAAVWEALETESLDALQKIEFAARRLAAMAGQRTLVLVSPGFLTETRAEAIDEIIHSALRQDVVISAIDASGLEPSKVEEIPTKERIIQRGKFDAGSVLASLVEGTGGSFFHNSNDFGEGFRETVTVPEVAYVLTFTPTDFKLDGKFHTLKVSLNEKKPWTLEARRGYFDPARALAQQAPGQDELDKLMFSGDEVHALPVDVHTEVGKQVKPPSTLTIVIHVDTRNLEFRREADRSVNTLTFDTALFDHDGKYVSGKEQSFDLHLTDTTLRKLERTGIYLKTSFQAAPGSYRIREVVRDVIAKEISALNCEALIPGTQDSTAAAGKPSRPERVLNAPQSMATWTTAQFMEAIPELRGLKPAASQDELPLILKRVGANVKAFFDTLPDITAHEEIILQRLDWANRPIDTMWEDFNYLDLSRPVKDGIGLQEYRTNRRGRRVEPKPLQGGFVTEGFTSILVHFHPIYQSDSTFRYLGRQVTHGQESNVVYFAQIPEKARIKEALNTDERSIMILMQGLAWIDPVNYQIVRMRTDLLFPIDDPYLREETTDSQFAAVRFPGDKRPVWLPVDVTVSLGWNRQSFRNDHHYSNFKLFRVGTETTVMSPQQNANRQ